MYKVLRTETYKVMYNPKTGLEILTGINGYSDPFVLDMPVLADIGIKGNCSNNDCKFCYQGNEQLPDMTFDNYKKIITHLGYHLNQVALGGKGNPNSHKNFEEIIDFSVANNIAVSYTTSGYDLTEKQVQISRKCGAVAVSITNEKDYTFSAIKMLQRANIKVNLHWVLSKQTIDDVIKVLNGYDIWKGKIDFSNLNAIILLSFKKQGRSKDLQENWNLNENDVKRLIPFLRNSKASFKVGADSCLFCKIGSVDKFTRNEELFGDTCEAARKSIYVNCDMKVMPCSYGDKINNSVVLTENETITNIWNNSKVFIETRNKLITNPFKCPFEL